MRHLSRRGLIGAACGLALLPCVALAAKAPDKGPRLTDQDRADIARVEAYLNEVRSLKAGFTQVAPDGQLSEGNFYLRRPGRLRFEYRPPVPMLIVGDGTWIVIHDSETNQVDRLPIGQTPLSVLVKDRVNLSDGMEVTRVRRQPGVLELSVVDPENRDQGSITLVFSDPPLELRQWLVTDAQGQVTSVQLHDATRNVELEAKLFVFTDPPGATRRER